MKNRNNPVLAGTRANRGRGTPEDVRAVNEQIDAQLKSVHIIGAVGSISAPGASETLDPDVSDAFEIALDGAITLVFSEPESDFAIFQLVLNQDGVGGHVVTWPASVEWDNGTAPVLNTDASNKSVLVFSTIDKGVTWFGNLVGDEVA